MATNSDKIREIAESAILVIVSRLSAPLLVGLCGFILHSVIDMKSNVAMVMAQVQGLDTRTSTLESWRNSLDAFASEVGRHHE